MLKGKTIFLFSMKIQEEALCWIGIFERNFIWAPHEQNFMDAPIKVEVSILPPYFKIYNLKW